jgi:aspartate dehydrogenase
VPPTLRIALIGLGSAGRRTAELVAAGEAGNAAVVGALVRRPEVYAATAARLGVPLVPSIDDLLALEPDVVVELGGHAALRDYGETVLRAGATLLTLSAGALADDAFRDRLFAAAASSGARIVLPSGAIAGLDAIESARPMGLERVRHVVRKPPKSLFDDPSRVAEVMSRGEAQTLYEGPAREGVRRFPANVNVVAMVCMAGLGFDRTTTVVIADPSVEHNTHEVTAEGAFGRIEVRVQNVPSPDNPKTGLIVAGSVVRALKRLDAPMNLGG